jgi:hypothetical protein
MRFPEAITFPANTYLQPVVIGNQPRSDSLHGVDADQGLT